MRASCPIYIPNGDESQLERQGERGIGQAGTSQPAMEPPNWAVPPANEEGEADSQRFIDGLGRPSESPNNKITGIAASCMQVKAPPAFPII